MLAEAFAAAIERIPITSQPIDTAPSIRLSDKPWEKGWKPAG